ncbi:MAG: hypothetical protein NC084_12905 [Bacteroides sp.]|nr:hypothetical protein [Eubacterium sp.]MCM1419573.1 hypothetical protein [Roseburia sp.]MCM1463594.1 hypothetical protein [Bacteroides sp.]
MTLIEFYRDEWRGAFDGEMAELERLLLRARDVIDGEISLGGVTVETIPETAREAVYKAICAQADFIDENGGIEAINNAGGSVSLGRFGYSGGGGEHTSSTLCDLARRSLIPTGLLYRGTVIL